MRTTEGKGKGKYGKVTGSKVNKSFLDEILPDELGKMIVEVLRAGDAVLVAVTKDESAVRVILMSGDEKESTYLGAADELHSFCKLVRQHLDPNVL